MRLREKLLAGVIFGAIGFATHLAAGFGATLIARAIVPAEGIEKSERGVIDGFDAERFATSYERRKSVQNVLLPVSWVVASGATLFIVANRVPLGRYRVRLVPKDDPTPEVFT